MSTLRSGLASAGVLVAIGLAALEAGIRQAGDFAFPLDDTYIHLAVARNLAFNGAWGVNPGEFSSASSSPLWTISLAALFTLAGARAWVALAVNVAMALVLGTHVERRFGRYAALVAGVAGALPAVVVLGLEHTAHAVIAVGFAGLLVGSDRPDRVRVPRVYLLAALLPMIRFEGTFEVLVGALVLIGRGERRRAARLLLAAAVPLAAFGAWSMAHGAWPVPNSLLMKGAVGLGFLANLRSNLAEGIGLVALLALVVACLPVAGSRRTEGLLFGGTACLHLLFAGTGWYYRYEAYLLVWGAAWTWSVLRTSPTRWRLLVATPAILLLGLRTIDALRYLPGRVVYIHDAKVVLARALADVAPGTTVAMHDIGAMVWVSGVRVVDTAGLGSDRIADLAVRRQLSAAAIARVAAEEHAVVGFATRSWMADARPDGWEPVCSIEWGLDNERRIEPLIVYAIQPEGRELGRKWAETAVSRMGGRGAIGQP